MSITRRLFLQFGVAAPLAASAMLHGARSAIAAAPKQMPSARDALRERVRSMFARPDISLRFIKPDYSPIGAIYPLPHYNWQVSEGIATYKPQRHPFWLIVSETGMCRGVGLYSGPQLLLSDLCFGDRPIPVVCGSEFEVDGLAVTLT